MQQVAAWQKAPMTRSKYKRAKAISTRTANRYIAAEQQFLRWGIRQGRWTANPLQDCDKWVVDPTFERRALTEEEIEKLFLLVPESLTIHYGMNGFERWGLYQVALATGLRVQELASLTPESFQLDVDPPCVRLRARSTKNKKEAVLPLHPELAEFLRTYLKGRKGPVWPATEWGWTKKAAEMLRADLQEAGISTENMDFHALRTTFCTRLARAGVHPVLMQTLARHADMRTTLEHYTRSDMAELPRAVAQVPYKT